VRSQVGRLEELDLADERFDKIFAVRVGLFRREPERDDTSSTAGSPPAASFSPSSIRRADTARAGHHMAEYLLVRSSVIWKH